MGGGASIPRGDSQLKGRIPADRIDPARYNAVTCLALFVPAYTRGAALTRFALLVTLLAAAPVSTRGAEPTPEAVEFFEKKVRPVLVEHCTRCHGDKKQQAELRLDTAEGLLKGSDGGPVVVPGDPDKSKLILSVRRVGDYAMPPNKPMAAADVAVLTQWVKTGAVFPKAGTTRAKPADAATHWAFQPVRDPQPPATKSPAGPNPIDAFVQAKLDAVNLTMAAPATRAVLIRRAYYDLIGLPPTAAQVRAFVADPSPRAFEAVVEELLASPHYGERWGRYWLDLARYADTKGYVFTENQAYPHAYTFRDYVVRSLNEDKPYDRFVTEQLAADQLPLGDDKHPLAAMGFLTVGRRFSNNSHDIIDDRIDVVTRGLMGLTVQCARCHDHKFDPVGIGDYYSLYAVFAASEEPKELPLIGAVERTPELTKFEAEVKDRERAIDEFKVKRHAEIVAELRTPASAKKYFDVARGLQGKPAGDVQAILRDQQLRPAALERTRQFLAKPLDERFRVYFTKAGPAEVPLAEFDRLILRDDRNKLVDLQKKIDTFKATSPFNPPRAMVLNDVEKPGDIGVFLRGNPNNRGPVVPRQFLQVGTLAKSPAGTGHSGRLEMAKAVVSPANPLTSRVMVNRVWMMHFGKPLVNTPSDFGLRSEPPSHPELLDWLATRFTADGWSLKKLHRRMMLSRAYQQASVASPESVARDPENRLLGHANRRRLDFEALRDSLLAVSGKLDPTVYGRSVDLFKPPYPVRRTLYGTIDRQNLPGTLRSFDLASPDQHSPGRFTTTVPQQALYLMNNPFVTEQARAVSQRRELAWPMATAERVRRLYAATLSRQPTPEETALAVEFVRTTPVKPWELLAQVLLCSNEFAFVD